MGVNILEARRRLSVNGLSLATAQSGNVADTDIIASFQSDSAYAIKQLVVNLPYKEGGYPGIRVTRSGKNLFDINLLANSDITVQNGEAVGIMNKFIEAYVASGSTKIPIRIDGNHKMCWTYTAWNQGNVSTSGNGAQLYWRFQNGTNKVTRTIPNSQTTPLTVVSQSYEMYQGALPLKAGFSAASQGTNIWHFSNMQFELGNTPTEYEAFKGNTYDTTFPATIYGGTYDLISGVLTGTKASDGTDLATPDVYQLTARVIPALHGVNNIWSDEGTVSVTYWTN